MKTLFDQPIPAESYVLKNAHVPTCLLVEQLSVNREDCLAHVDLFVTDGKLERILPAGVSGGFENYIDLDGGMVIPAPIDMHTHLDKGHIWHRQPNPDGTFSGALQATGDDRSAHWTEEDVRTRMEFALRCAYVHGTCAIRTHLDSIPPQDEISWPLFEQIKSEWADRIDLQAVCLFGIDRLDADDHFLQDISARVASHDGVLGAVTYMVPRLEEHLDAVFHAALDHGLSLDFHVDETLDPSACSLRYIAEAALRNKYDGKIVCGHCCSLSQHDSGAVDQTLDLVARSDIGIVSLPMCNMYLQDRHASRTPRQRGVTLLHEMKAHGIPVAVASDNTRDPFYAYGDLDLIEVYAYATRTLHFDHPVSDWVSTITAAPAKMIEFDGGNFTPGRAADLVLFRARNWNEFLSRPHGPREVVRDGQAIDRTLPDYRELDT
ncbi:cytosine deaminase [Roseibium hamelinense]|uniref:Cytosine deaminase n=1 Tax=Roseibium hamelinense TaxID=150831 RepID=A0A562SNS7_9HYPH|nr:cytosine deaminase [Roseibium hamelinense]MTI45085.1 cytosine deaminase [Roseibium hamelinense]TWI82350.1 cytosine deaminase [Roseibium hamelinense]